MKILKYNFLILGILGLILSSCGESEEEIFRGEPGQQTLLTFNSTTNELPVVVDSSTTIEVEVNVSTRAETARTFNIIQIDEETNVSPALGYEFENTVTIPPNSYTGTFTVTGFDNGLEDENSRITLALNEESTDDLIVESNTVSITAFRICPVPDDFLVGTYRLENVSSTLGPGNDSENFESGIVNLRIGDNPINRIFSVTPLPGFGESTQVTIRLVCGRFVLQTVDLGFGCVDGPNIVYDAADISNQSTYDDENELNSYTINYSEDANGSCGGPFQSSFSLTKVD